MSLINFEVDLVLIDGVRDQRRLLAVSALGARALAHIDDRRRLIRCRDLDVAAERFDLRRKYDHRGHRQGECKNRDEGSAYHGLPSIEKAKTFWGQTSMQRPQLVQSMPRLTPSAPSCAFSAAGMTWGSGQAR